jgi:hypothetical protein
MRKAESRHGGLRSERPGQAVLQGNGDTEDRRLVQGHGLLGQQTGLGQREGSNLVETLGNVSFSKRQQQINIMGKSSGETIVSIAI